MYAIYRGSKTMHSIVYGEERYMVYCDENDALLYLYTRLYMEKKRKISIHTSFYFNKDVILVCAGFQFLLDTQFVMDEPDYNSQYEFREIEDLFFYLFYNFRFDERLYEITTLHNRLLKTILEEEIEVCDYVIEKMVNNMYYQTVLDMTLSVYPRTRTCQYVLNYMNV
jgi:hypothetical protein